MATSLFRHERVLTTDISGFTNRINDLQADITVLQTRQVRLQADLDAWLRHYNYERPHLGYRNQGHRPYDRLRQYLIDSSARTPGAAAAEALAHTDD